jgi:type IV secretory pathway VirB2 component (pilin)
MPQDPLYILQLETVFKNIITFLLGIAGGVAIIIIIVGGIRYILSGGDPKATMSARNSITFGVVGLIIIILATSIVIILGKIFGYNGSLDIFNISIQ